MRRTIPTLANTLMLAALPSAVFAQPTLTEADFFGIGDSAVEELHPPGVEVSAFTTPGPEGAWDLTTLGTVPYEVNAIDCLSTSAGGFGGEALFPAADRALRRLPSMAPEAPAIWEYRSLEASGRTQHGIYFDLPPAPFVGIFVPPYVDYPLPLTLGQQWTEETEIDVLGLINQRHTVATVDAWGPAELPGVGTVNCLRVHREVTVTLLMDIGVGQPVETGVLYSQSYAWLAEGIDVVATITSDPNPAGLPPADFAVAGSVSVLVDFVEADGGTSYVRGEANGDGGYDLADPIQTLGYLYDGGSLACVAAADVNGDGAVDCADAVYSLEYLFSEGPPPMAPYPDCGADAPADLSCEQSTCP